MDAFGAGDNMQKIVCPSCKKIMIETDNSKKTASNYYDCIRKCLNCEIGASNAEDNPTIIYCDYKKSIPTTMLDNLETSLIESQNIQNRKNKINKFGFSTSEDAFTWIFVRFHIKEKRLNKLAEYFSLNNEIQEILLWGVPHIQADSPLKNRLQKICIDLGENINSLSEPDIIIVTSTEVAFVEVKLKSSNDVIKNKDNKFNKYLKDFYCDDLLAIKSKHYELIRNWTIGNIFSDGKIFTLINLGPNSLFYDKNKSRLDYFEDSIADKSRFRKIAWEDILAKLENDRNDSEIIENLLSRFRRITAST